jgi:hypothetical protein
VLVKVTMMPASSSALEECTPCASLHFDEAPIRQRARDALRP